MYTDLGMMAGVATTCEECEGRRFQASVLGHHLGGRDISEVLAMSATEAAAFFGDGEARTPAAHAILDRLVDVGLGYLRLGQPLTTLSGGEQQRLKLATHMGGPGRVYVLDEPTAGLHLADASSSSAFSTGSSTPAGRSWSSSTTRPSWPTPTGSSTSVPGRARRWPGPVRGHARRPRQGAVDPHRRAPRGLRRRLTCLRGTPTGGRPVPGGSGRGPVAVAELAPRGDPVAHGLLHRHRLGEPPVRAVPHHVPVDPHDQHAARAGHEGDLAHVPLEGAEQLLGQPGGAR